MSRFAGLALVLLALAFGCSQAEAPTDPTAAALEQLRDHKFDEAIKSASEAIAQSPNNAAAYLYRGRAYYYRAGMGDAHRAIEDLGAAIRLAPESSEGYYFRALVYRELGQTDLADKDDLRARELDHLAQEAFEKLPDENLNEFTDVKPIEPDDVKAAEPRTKSAAEMLRDSTAAADQTGVDRDTSGELPGALSGGTESGAPAPVESEFNKQYRALLGQSALGEPTAPADGAPTDAFGRPLGQPAPTAPLNPSGLSAAPLPSSENGAGANPASRPAWSRTQVPSLQSPFTQRTAPAAGSAPGMPPSTQSPFPQAARGATGYVPPVSPFGLPAGQTAGAAGVSRPFSTPTTTARPQNNAVRPAYPRDYIP